jgi:hypothetical protein
VTDRNKSLVSRENVEGYEGIRPDDLMIARLRLVQSVSRLPGEPKEGTIYNTTTQECAGKVRVVVIGIKHTQVYWDEINADRPACASDNGNTPREDIERPVCGSCSACSKSKWSTNGSKRVPPECSDRITFLVIDRDELVPALVDFYKTSYVSGRAIITTLFSTQKPPYYTPIDLMPRFVTKDKFSYYVWSFARSEYQEGELDTMQQLYEYYRNQSGIMSAEMASSRMDEDDVNRPVDVEEQGVPNDTEKDTPW